jgi:hypothetical protein
MVLEVFPMLTLSRQADFFPQLHHCRRDACLGKLLGRDERGYEGAGPGLERLGHALRKDRVQGGAEQPDACIGVRLPHIEDQLAYGSPAEHFVRLLGSKPERVPFSGCQGRHELSLESVLLLVQPPGDQALTDAAETQLAESRHADASANRGSPTRCRKKPAGIVTAAAAFPTLPKA